MIASFQFFGLSLVSVISCKNGGQLFVALTYCAKLIQLLKVLFIS